MQVEDRSVASPVSFKNLGIELELPPEALGQHTDEVLAEYGYDEEKIKELRDAGIIG